MDKAAAMQAMLESAEKLARAAASTAERGGDPLGRAQAAEALARAFSLLADTRVQ